MNIPVVGKILTVGDGDFSFSLALLSYHTSANIVSTCYQEKKNIIGNLQLLRNASKLEKSGVTVLFGVDATRLNSCGDIKGQLFSRIIFNFPHTGRKAAIKKNRNLLKDFFSGAEQYLQENGDICVTLAKGQGGTPADKFMREWYNSWQIVSMATYSNLILKKAISFQASCYPEYTCTGYRNRDKSFGLEGAVTYVFSRGNPLNIFEKISLKKEYVDVDYYLEKIIRNRNQDSKSAFVYFKDHIFSYLKENFSCHIWSEDSLDIICDSSSLEKKGDYVPVSEGTSSALHLLKPLANNCNSVTTGYLRHTLLDHLSTIFSLTVDRSQVFCGEVFRQCQINSDSMPVHYEILVRCRSVEVDSFVEGVFDSFLPSCKVILKPLGKLLYIGGQNLDQLFEINLHCESKVETKVGKIYKISQTCDFDTILILNLDAIILKCTKVIDWRLLWSPHFKIQNYSDESLEQFFPIPSLYPPQYIHDMSFWIGDHFDEIRFLNLIRCITQDLVLSVQFLEKFQYPQTERISYSYRLVYQSCDQAFSKKQATELQLILRNIVEQDLRIQLR